MPSRILKESIKTSDEIDALSWFEEVCFYRILVTVDDYGCMDGRTVVVKNQLFPTKENVTVKSIADALSRLEAKGLIKRYSHEGHPYIFVKTWEKHQRIRNKERRFPDPAESDLSADCGQLSADCCQMSADCGQVSANCGRESNPNPIQKESESEYESNPKGPLALALDAFREYRRQMRKPLTDRAESMLIKKLEKLAPGDEDAQITMLEESMVNGWAGVWPVRGDTQRRSSQENDHYANLRNLYAAAEAEESEQQGGDTVVEEGCC